MASTLTNAIEKAQKWIGKGANNENNSFAFDLGSGKRTLLSSVLGVEGHTDIMHDGDRALNFDPGSFFHTGHQRMPWWQVDLETECEIDRVLVANRPDYQHRANRLIFASSLDGVSWEFFHVKNDDIVFGSGPGEEYNVPAQDRVARFIRIYLVGFGCLHLGQCRVIGRKADQNTVDLETARQLQRLSAFEANRRGTIALIDGFHVFVDNDRYSERVAATIHGGAYEATERQLVSELLQHDDRVLEVGTAVGVVAMNAAIRVGSDNVTTFDANPQIVADARRNFAFNGFRINSQIGVLRNRSKCTAEATTKFFISRDFWGSRLFAQSSDGDIIETVEVPYAFLEDEIEKASANVLICDIEGGEVDLLVGADLSAIRLIILEIHYWAVGEIGINAMTRYLINIGFNLDFEKNSANVLAFRR